MDGWVRVLHPFNSISVISRRWKGEHERLCAMKCRLGSGRILPPAGFEPATPWSEVWSANRSATRTRPSFNDFSHSVLRRRFLMFFTIYGLGGHLGNVTTIIWTNFCSPISRRIYMKFYFNWPSDFENVDKDKTWVTLDQGQRMTLTSDIRISSCIHVVYNTYRLLHQRQQ